MSNQSPFVPTAEQQATIDDLIFQGSWIAAVKYYREIGGPSGIGLKEARDYVVDVRRPELKRTAPGKFAPAGPARPFLADLQKEIDHWKAVAAILANMHAATLLGLPKSASKSERRRQTKICMDAARMLQGLPLPPVYSGAKAEVVSHAIARCKKTAAKCGLPE